MYVTGSTEGSFDGYSNAGGRDSTVIKFSSSGEIAWSRQIGTTKNDEGNALVLDSKGNVLVVGTTEGDFDGKTNPYLSEAFLMSYDTSGVKQ